MTIQLLQHALGTQWPDAEVRSFGSQDTQLYLPQGDIDLVILSRQMDARPREVVLRQMASCLRYHNLATDIQVIARAKVPIIKFVCTYGRFNVDISVNQANGLRAAQFVNSWLRKQPSVRPLVMVVKQLLQQRALSEVFTGGLGSYSVTLLALSFLQLHPKIQQGEIVPERNLGTLLMEFLELYGKNFGYDECGISVRGLGGYYNKRHRGFYDPKKPFLLSIEDPHDTSNDIAKGSFAAISVRSALGGAFDILHSALCERANGLSAFRRHQHELHDASRKRSHTHFGDDAAASRVDAASDIKEPESLLGSVLGVSREMIKRRKEIQRLYVSNALQERLAQLQARTGRGGASDGPTEKSPTSSPSSGTAPESESDSGAEPQDAAHTTPAQPQSEAPSHSVHKAPAKPAKRRTEPPAPRSEDSSESKYATPRQRPAKQRRIDPWASNPRGGHASSDSAASDDSLEASDAPFVHDSSDSDESAPERPQSRPAERARQGTPGLSIPGTAKKAVRPAERAGKLSKNDRMAYWRNKGSINAMPRNYDSP